MIACRLSRLKTMKNSIVITGASGFVGSQLSTILRESFNDVLGLTSNRLAAEQKGNLHLINYDDINAVRDILETAETLIHCAGLAHQNEANSEKYFAVNVDLTAKLATQAKLQKINLFIFLSTAKIYGDYGYSRNTTKEGVDEAPNSDYAHSKQQAEAALIEIFKNSQTKLVILRLPLLYGSRNKGNLKRMDSMIRKGLPLPFYEITKNQISLLSINNLINFIIFLCKKKHLQSDTFNLSDAISYSTSDIFSYVAMQNDLPIKRFLLFKKITKFLIKILFKDEHDRLYTDMEICTDKVRQIHNWRPEEKLMDGVRGNASNYV